jgi:hypothetical protein
MGIIAPPGYPKMVSTPSIINASNKATEPETSVVAGDFTDSSMISLIASSITF